MPVQTAYSAEQALAFEGQRADLGLINVISKAAEDSAIDFGRAVCQGTGDNQCLLATATGGKFLGVSEFTNAGVANASDVLQYEENTEVNIVNFGYVWVICEDGCVPGDDAFFRHTAGAGGTTIGAFRTDADTASADQITDATFESTAAAGGLALLKLPKLY